MRRRGVSVSSDFFVARENGRRLAVGADDAVAELLALGVVPRASWRRFTSNTPMSATQRTAVMR
jgi:hypothetical protein